MSELRDDPVYVASLREALVAIGLWVVCGAYTITYCYLNGYGENASPLETVAGIPSWIFYGVVIPWLLVNVFAVWYCFFFVKDQDLGEEPEETSEAS